MICNKGKVLKTLHTETFFTFEQLFQYIYILYLYLTYILRMSNLLEVNDFHISTRWRMLKKEL